MQPVIYIKIWSVLRMLSTDGYAVPIQPVIATSESLPAYISQDKLAANRSNVASRFSRFKLGESLVRPQPQDSTDGQDIISYIENIVA
jgi:hypothetical protein